MKLGCIDYLNCYPFYYHMLEKSALADVTVVPRLPGELNAMMAAGALDISPISAAAYAGMRDRLVLLPDFCLSSVGYVASVILVSRRPLEDLHHRKVGLSRASHTSAVLLKILLKKHYGAEPDYQTTHHRAGLADLDAVMLIGNDAMADFSGPGVRVYDLGELWLEKTGFPVVFAVFALQKAAVETKMPQIQAVIQSYHRSMNCLKTEKETVVAGARRRYPDILYDVAGYYDLLRFEFADELKQALGYYFDAAADLGFLQKVGRIEFLKLV